MASESLQSVYATALRNTHALEQEALQVMERQVERLENYPEVKQALPHSRSGWTGRSRPWARAPRR